MNKWYQGKIVKGKGFGKKIGFPTLNIDKPEILERHNPGVYACRVKIKNKIYQGALFYGPKLIHNEMQNSLEIYIFSFEDMIYEEKVSFQLSGYIRPKINFPNAEKLKKQLKIDCKKAKEILDSSKI